MLNSLLAEVRDLERRDADLALKIEDLIALEHDIANLRSAAGAITIFSDALPEARLRALEEIRRAEEEAKRRAEAVRTADAELAAAKGDDARASAERAVATAETSRRTAESRLAHARDELATLEREAAANQTDSASIEARARALAERVGDTPEPGLDGVERWGSRARAKVFAERTHAESERQQLITQANELGSAALGEPLLSSSVSEVRRQVEALNRG
jgi:DNA repair exonuclease SbcCD ATPase subunit